MFPTLQFMSTVVLSMSPAVGYIAQAVWSMSLLLDPYCVIHVTSCVMQVTNWVIHFINCVMNVSSCMIHVTSYLIHVFSSVIYVSICWMYPDISSIQVWSISPAVWSMWPAVWGANKGQVGQGHLAPGMSSGPGIKNYCTSLHYFTASVVTNMRS